MRARSRCSMEIGGRGGKRREVYIRLETGNGQRTRKTAFGVRVWGPKGGSRGWAGCWFQVAPESTRSTMRGPNLDDHHGPAASPPAALSSFRFGLINHGFCFGSILFFPRKRKEKKRLGNHLSVSFLYADKYV